MSCGDVICGNAGMRGHSPYKGVRPPHAFTHSRAIPAGIPAGIPAEQAFPAESPVPRSRASAPAKFLAAASDASCDAPADGGNFTAMLLSHNLKQRIFKPLVTHENA